MGEARLQDWVGRSQEVADTIHPLHVRAFSATLNAPLAAEPGDPLPELWHWLYFLPTVPMAEIGPDGHPRRGGFLPPVELDRRMWAGGRLSFHGALRVGDAVRQRSEILKVQREGGPGRADGVRHRAARDQLRARARDRRGAGHRLCRDARGLGAARAGAAARPTPPGREPRRGRHACSCSASPR